MKFILGHKLAMTQVYGEKGDLIPVTAVKVGPCVVTQVKTTERDGYDALQMGYGEKKNVSMAVRGHVGDVFTGREGRGFKFLKEFRTNASISDAAKGAMVDISSFAVGDVVAVTGTSKGKGFAGVVKRHHFRGHPTSHGHKDQERMPGSIGAGGIQHVFKGQRMGGHMGDEQVTVKGLPIISLDVEAGIVYVKGAVPGARNGMLILAVEKGEMVFKAATPSVVAETQSAPVEEEVVAAPVVVAEPVMEETNDSAGTPETPAEEAPATEMTPVVEESASEAPAAETAEEKPVEQA